MCALAQIFKTSSTKDICSFWSLETNRIVRQVWESNVGVEQQHLALFALGKWGAEELNLSSDIDIIIVSFNAFIIYPLNWYLLNIEQDIGQEVRE